MNFLISYLFLSNQRINSLVVEDDFKYYQIDKILTETFNFTIEI